MDVKSLHVQSVACPRMRTLVLQTMDFQSIVVDLSPDKRLQLGKPCAMTSVRGQPDGQASLCLSYGLNVNSPWYPVSFYFSCIGLMGTLSFRILLTLGTEK